MHNYDFRSLNDKEFESMVIDLLSCEFRQRIERFKPGKDRGVDGRFFQTDKSEVIIQCKHYLKSGFKPLLKKMKTGELKKVKELNPKRYIVATSIELSKLQKRQIKEALEPYVLSEADVFGAEDFNDLLGRHPEVEKRHYKLWLSSTTVLLKIMNNAITGRSGHLIKEAQVESKKYVTTLNHEIAMDKIKETHAIILTGEPGIGKTTLANSLCLYYAGIGFDILCIEDAISEAEAAYVEDKPQLFYYDDFLGRNYLTALNNKADSHIVHFIRRVQKDKLKRFILTSRTNILNQGKRLSELFEGSDIERNEFEVKVENINRKDKAQILYNHIFFSNLSEQFIEEIYKNKRYLSIINHNNYNPRLIEFITDKDKVVELNPSRYWDYITATLNNPVDIWEKAFEVQIDNQGRDIVSLIVMNGGTLKEDALQSAFSSMSEVDRSAYTVTIITDFYASVRPLTKALLNKNLNQETKMIEFDLFNPSIGDYVIRRLAGDKLYLAKLFYSLNTLQSLHNLKNIYKNQTINKDSFIFILNELSKKIIREPKIYDDYNFLLAYILIENKAIVGDKKLRELLLEFLSDIDFFSLDLNVELTFLKVVNFTLDFDPRLRGDTELRIYILNNIDSFWEHDVLVELCFVVTSLDIVEQEGLISSVKKQIIECWEDSLPEYIAEEGIVDDILNEDEMPTAKARIYKFVERYFADYSIFFDNKDIMKICNSISVEGIIYENQDRDAREQYEENMEPSGYSSDKSDNEFIEDLFYRER